MFDFEEKGLTKLNETMKNMPRPDNINEYVRKGVADGIRKKKRNRVRMYSNIAAVLVLVSFITSVRTIPTFAYYMSKIPGIEYIVKLINYDKGVKSAVENNFVESINQSVTHEGLTFTIKDMILDSSKGIIFYSIENKTDHRYVNLENMRFLDEKGEHIIAGTSWGSFIDKDMAVDKKLEGMVEINFTEETVLPDRIYISVALRESKAAHGEPGYEEKVLAPEWKFELPVDKEKIRSMQRTYVLNQSVEVEDQRILFKEVTITPIRAAVKIEYDKSNTKKILRFDDLKLVNEKGETWATIINGVSGSRIDENHEVLYFQSSYFTDPKELYIEGSSIRAMDKDKCRVEIDVEKGTLLKAPDERLSLSSVNKSGSSLTLNFKLKVDNPLDEYYSYNIFSYDIKDASGRSYKMGSAGSGSAINGVQDSHLTISEAENLKGPLYLMLEDYPVRIVGDFKVRVK